MRQRLKRKALSLITVGMLHTITPSFASTFLWRVNNATFIAESILFIVLLP